jgi:hypothetical protein
MRASKGTALRFGAWRSSVQKQREIRTASIPRIQEFDNVTISGAMKISGVHADLALGPGPVNFRPAG